MKTIKCKYCGEEIASSSKRCKYCGGNYGMPNWLNTLLIVIAIIIGLLLIALLATILLVFLVLMILPILFIILIVSEASNVNYSSNYFTNNTSPYYINEVYKTKDLEAKLINYENDYSIVIDENTNVIKYTVNVKNKNSKNNLNVSTTNFRCYSDSVLYNKYLGTTGNSKSITLSIEPGDDANIDIYCKAPKLASKNILRYRGADFKID